MNRAKDLAFPRINGLRESICWAQVTIGRACRGIDTVDLSHLTALRFKLLVVATGAASLSAAYVYLRGLTSRTITCGSGMTGFGCAFHWAQSHFVIMIRGTPVIAITFLWLSSAWQGGSIDYAAAGIQCFRIFCSIHTRVTLWF